MHCFDKKVSAKKYVGHTPHLGCLYMYVFMDHDQSFGIIYFI